MGPFMFIYFVGGSFIQSFSMKSIVMGPFMFQKTVYMTFITDRCDWNFFCTGESVTFHSMDCFFGSGSSWQIHGEPICKNLFH